MRRAMLRSVRCCGVLASICVKRAISATWTPLAARPAALVQRSGQRARGLHGRGCRCWEVPRPAMTKSSLPSRSCAAALAAHAAHPAQLHQCWTRTQRTQRTGATQLCQNAASEKKTPCDTIWHDSWSCDKVQKNTSGSIALTDD